MLKISEADVGIGLILETLITNLRNPVHGHHTIERYEPKLRELNALLNKRLDTKK